MEVHMLLQLPTQSRSYKSPNVLPDTEHSGGEPHWRRPVVKYASHPKFNHMVSLVHRIINLALQASGQTSIPRRTAENYVSILLQQTQGYNESIEDVVQRHMSAHRQLASVLATETNCPGLDGKSNSSRQLPLNLDASIQSCSHTEAGTEETSHAACKSVNDSSSNRSSISEAVGLYGFADSTGEAVRVGCFLLPGLPLDSAWCMEVDGRVRSRVVRVEEMGGKGGDVPQYLRLWSLSFTTQCEHHMLPFYGHVHTAVPRECAGNVTSEIVRDIVDMYSCRLQVQERLAQQVVDGLHQLTGNDVLVVCSAAHMCMVARGVERHAAVTSSTAVRGTLENSPGARAIWLECLISAVSELNLNDFVG